ncbi:MAG: MCE family protein [Solirubrobacteraceae bacterium]|nr:MCE family protein [Solirubrobacteraceae bacterium]
MSRNLVVWLVAGVVAVAGYIVVTGGDDPYRVQVELENAGGLRQHSSVKIAGVPGGSVSKIEITDKDTAIATLDLDDSAAPIGRDASVKIRPTDLLGERYVDLDPGDAGDSAPDGFRIAKSKAKLPVELDDILNSVDGETQARLKVLINEFGIGLGSRGKDFAKLLNVMPPALDEARALVRQLSEERDAIERLLVKGDRITASVAPKRDELAKLMDDAERTLKVVADRRGAMGSAIDSAPPALARLQSTLRTLDHASLNMRPAADDLRDATRPLTAVLREMPDFEDAAKPALDAARKASPALRKLGDDARAPLNRLMPTLGRIEKISDSAVPTLNHLEYRGFEDLLWFVQNWSIGMKQRDALGHQVGAMATVAPETAYSIIDGLLGGGPGHGGDAATNGEGDFPQAKSRTKAPARTTRRTLSPPTEPSPEQKPKPADDPVKQLVDDVDRALDPVARVVEPVTKGLNDLTNALGLTNGGKKRDKPGGKPSGSGLDLLDQLLAP